MFVRLACILGLTSHIILILLAFIFENSSLEPLLEGLFVHNPC